MLCYNVDDATAVWLIMITNGENILKDLTLSGLARLLIIIHILTGLL